MNYPPYFNDPNDPHSQPTTAGQYPQWGQPEPTTAGQYPQWGQQAPPPQQPGQPSYPQWGQQAPPPPPHFPQQPGQYPQSGQNFPPYPQHYSQNGQWSQPGQPSYPQPGQFGPPPQPVPDKLPLFDVKARKEYFKRHPEAQKKQFLIGCGTLIGIFLLCALCSAIGNASQSTQQPAGALVSSPTAMQAPTDTPTPEPTDDTPEPTDTPTPTPTPEPTQPPVQQPIQQQPAAQLFVTITSAYATDYSSGSVSVHTLPGAALTISVTYCSGRSATSGSLQGTKYADSAGNYTWTWEPETKCKGTATAYVSASLNGQSASDSKDFTVS